MSDESSQPPFYSQKPRGRRNIIEEQTDLQSEHSPEDDENKQTVDIKDIKNQNNDEKQPFLVCEVGQTKKTRRQKKSRKIRKEIYMFPGESKNIPKNFIRAFKEFIYHNIESSKRTCLMNKFLALKPEKACKQTLLNILKDIKMKQLAQQFFGQFRWASIFLAENKVSLEQYFRFKNLYFQRKKIEEVGEAEFIK